MTPPDYDDLLRRLRELYVQHGTNYVQAAANAIAALRADNAALRAILTRNQFALNGYCPECGGWNSNPNDPDRGDSRGFHTKNCEVAALLAGKESVK